jgi:hypothetical protein
MGWESQLYLFPHAYQRTRHFGAVVSLRGASGWVDSPLMNSQFWRSMMDCGNDGGRVPRPVLPQGVTKLVG